MSADNYVLIRQIPEWNDGWVATDESASAGNYDRFPAPWRLIGGWHATRDDALAAAGKYCSEEIVEYGMTVLEPGQLHVRLVKGEPEADPELDRLLAEEEEIERAYAMEEEFRADRKLPSDRQFAFFKAGFMCSAEGYNGEYGAPDDDVLRRHYNKLVNEERFPVEDWQHEVANGDTRLGYDDWLEHQIEANS